MLRRPCPRLVDNDRRHTFRPNCGDEFMAIELFAFDGEEQITRLCLPRIGTNIFKIRLQRAGDDFGIASFGDKFQRARFHDIFQNLRAEFSTTNDAGVFVIIFGSGGMFK